MKINNELKAFVIMLLNLNEIYGPAAVCIK